MGLFRRGGLPMRSASLAVGALSVLLAACSSSDSATVATTAPASVAANPTSAPTVAAAPSTPVTGSSAAPTAAPSAPAIKITGPFSGEAKNLDGAGATFPAPLYTKWFSDYEKLTQVKINYQSIGSGGGIQGIQTKTVDFGASDAFLTDEQVKSMPAPVLHVPMTMGAVVATYNITGYTGKLKLTSDTLAAIFTGDITKWNDAKLLADNPDLKSLNADIVTIHRSDASGTTNAFTDYLAKANSKWKSSIGAGTSVNWPGGLGARGNDGVAGEVKNNPNSIGYVDLIYAVQQKLGVADQKNKAGNFVSPTLDTVSNAAAAYSATLPDDLRQSITNADGAQSWPIATYTYVLVYKDIADKAKAQAITRMLWWAIHDGQAATTDLSFSKLPDSLVKKDEVVINSVTTGGAKAFPGQ